MAREWSSLNVTVPAAAMRAGASGIRAASSEMRSDIVRLKGGIMSFRPDQWALIGEQGLLRIAMVWPK
jgi:hypothetical protein